MGEPISSLNIEKKLSELREKKGTGKVSFSGRKNVATIEKEMEDVFGLFIQISFTEKDGSRYYTTSEDSKTLTQLNREKRSAGCKKDIWK